MISDKALMTTPLRHILIMTDGNGRWATRQNLPRNFGHSTGTRYIKEIIEECILQKVEYLTLYVFSTENWKRSEQEVSIIFDIFNMYLKDILTLFLNNGTRFHCIGDIERLDISIQNTIEQAIQLTKQNSVLNLTVALSYGGRADILNAVRKIFEVGGQVEEITEEFFTSFLSSTYMPDPDIIIRTGGELRLSNGFLWEAAYSELWFTDITWPDFRSSHLREAIEDFYTRRRTFGDVPSGVE